MFDELEASAIHVGIVFSVSLLSITLHRVT